MTKSNYNYSIEDYAGRNVIVIEDLNLGNMSVTNDIDNVIEEICQKEDIQPKLFMVVYKDSEGFFDGWDTKRYTFIYLACKTWESAVSKYVDLQITKEKIINQQNQS